MIVNVPITEESIEVTVLPLGSVIIVVIVDWSVTFIEFKYAITSFEDGIWSNEAKVSFDSYDESVYFNCASKVSVTVCLWVYVVPELWLSL